MLVKKKYNICTKFITALIYYEKYKFMPKIKNNKREEHLRNALNL